MAQRYGGKYSPEKDVIPEVVDERKVDAAGARANILFVPGVILALFAINDGPVALAVNLVAAGTLTLAAWLLRDGLRAHAAYDARKVARAPALPRKMISSVLTGVGIGLAAYINNSGMLGAQIYGFVAMALHIAAFGIDPLQNKRMEGIDTFQQDRVAKVVDEAENHLSVIKGQIEALSDRPMELRVNDFLTAARKMIRTVEEDPRDLTGARKYLGVYLMGARDATIKFVDLYKRQQNPEARANYEALLTDLEQNFAAKTKKMLLDDKSDMDIEIKVLRDRLQREGVSLK